MVELCGARSDFSHAVFTGVRAEDAVFAVPAARLGLGYHAAGLEKLVSVVGQAAAREIFFTARRFDAREDGLAGVMILYLLAAVAAAKIAEIFGADPESHFVRLTAGSSAQIVGIAACLFVAARAFPGGVRTFLLGTGETRPAFIAVLTLAALVIVIGVCPLVLRASIAIIESFIPGYEFAPHPTITALHESDSIDIEHSGRIRVVSHLRRVACNAENVPQTDRMSAEDVRLHAEDVPISA